MKKKIVCKCAKRGTSTTLIFFEEISVITNGGQLSSVQLQKFTKFWCFCMYILFLNIVQKLKC